MPDSPELDEYLRQESNGHGTEDEPWDDGSGFDVSITLSAADR
jgi:hypothetical protein